MILMKCSREKKVAATEKGCKKGRVDIVRGRTMGRNMLADSRSHGCVGIPEHKKMELRIKVGTDDTETLPPGSTLGGCHFLVVTRRSLGFTVGSMKVETIHKPRPELNTNEKDGWLGTNESDGIHGGRTIVDFELGVNTGFNAIVTELITL